MNLGIFYRHTDDVVERILAFEDNVSISRPENIGIKQYYRNRVQRQIHSRQMAFVHERFQLWPFRS